jgi:signal transduction histidine kinase
MLVIKNISQLAKYESMKIENHFYELLTATVSHEMRTPLNAIISLLLSLDMHVNTALGKKLLQIIQNSSKILLFLVNDMLDIF